MSTSKELETVYCNLSYGSLEQTPLEFLAEITEAINSIPPEYMADAKVSLEAEDQGWESYKGKIEIYYFRPSTPEEIAERERKSRQRLETDYNEAIMRAERLRQALK